MFGYVTANVKELDKDQRKRYTCVYCGICRQIRLRASSLSRLSLSYDTAFLALLLMSLYEPQEESGKRACGLHPVRPRPWVDNEYIRYAADMNVALAYYSCQDDWNDDRSLKAKAMTAVLRKHHPVLEEKYPRQMAAIRENLELLGRLEQENCENIDEPANAFGNLMAEMMVYHDDLWQQELRSLGFHLGRFIYLADAISDYEKDQRKHSYNPLLAGDHEKDPAVWEEFLILALGKCTESFEKLPLVQDKALLDNILYSGVWTNFQKKAGEPT